MNNTIIILLNYINSVIEEYNYNNIVINTKSAEYLNGYRDCIFTILQLIEINQKEDKNE